MKTLLLTLSLVSLVATLPAPAATTADHDRRDTVRRIPEHLDVILEWNAGISGFFSELSPAHTSHVQARVYALTHLAMREAIIATMREVRPDLDDAAARSAATAAAHHTLVELCPVGEKRFDLRRDRIMAAIGSDVAARGKQIGRQVSSSLLRSRTADGWPVLHVPGAPLSGALKLKPETTAKVSPFVLKRVHQIEPEPPWFAYQDGLVLPNDRLLSTRYIGSPHESAPDERTCESWREDTIRQWNRVAQSLAAGPQDLLSRARLFAVLNQALADALLTATHWSELYRQGRQELTTQLARTREADHDPIHRMDKQPEEDGPRWMITRSPGFPAIPATLAGAAEAVLQHHMGRNPVFVSPMHAKADSLAPGVTSLQAAARECAWAALADNTSSFEGCVAGYELGRRIGAYVLKQDRR